MALQEHAGTGVARGTPVSHAPGARLAAHPPAVPLALFSNGAFLYGKKFWEGNVKKVSMRAPSASNPLCRKRSRPACAELALFRTGLPRSRCHARRVAAQACIIIVIKITVLPFLQLACTKALGLSTSLGMSLILLSICPCATTGFVLASSYGHGAEIITMVRRAVRRGTGAPARRRARRGAVRRLLIINQRRVACVAWRR